MKAKFQTREAWLNVMAGKLHPLFDAIGYDVPGNLKMSCGWSSRGARGKAGLSRIGECWGTESSSMGYSEIFISPIIDDSLEVTATLAHEIIHAIVGVKNQHNKVFGKVARSFGFKGPMKQTPMGDKLRERLNALVSEVGPYPHARMEVLISGKKKQTTRMLKLVCPNCGYTVRVAAKWLEEGVPTCPCGTVMTEDGNENEDV